MSYTFELASWKDDAELRAEVEKLRAEDEDFANDPIAQLQYLYERAPMYEIEKYNRLYPVGRLNTEIKEIEQVR